MGICYYFAAVSLFLSRHKFLPMLLAHNNNVYVLVMATHSRSKSYTTQIHLHMLFETHINDLDLILKNL